MQSQLKVLRMICRLKYIIVPVPEDHVETTSLKKEAKKITKITQREVNLKLSTLDDPFTCTSIELHYKTYTVLYWIHPVTPLCVTKV